MQQNEKFTKIIELNEDLIKNNDTIAFLNKKKFDDNKIISFDIVGAIGAGKTALLEAIVEELSDNKRILVINGDVATRIDADRIEEHGAKTIQVNTGRECALNSYHISQVLNNIDMDDYDLVFIENVGNLICPSDFILGVHKRIVVVSITEGPWVIKKHPLLFKMSDIAVINKIDLIDVIDVDVEDMVNDAIAINPDIKVFITSAKTKENVKEVLNAIME